MRRKYDLRIITLPQVLFIENGCFEYLIFDLAPNIGINADNKWNSITFGDARWLDVWQRMNTTSFFKLAFLFSRCYDTCDRLLGYAKRGGASVTREGDRNHEDV